MREDRISCLKFRTNKLKAITFISVEILIMAINWVFFSIFGFVKKPKRIAINKMCLGNLSTETKLPRSSFPMPQIFKLGV